MYQSSSNTASDLPCHPSGAGFQAPVSSAGTTAALRRIPTVLGLSASVLALLYGCGGAAPTQTVKTIGLDPFEGSPVTLADRAAPIKPKAPVPAAPPARRIDAHSTSQLVELFREETFDLNLIRRGRDGVPRVLVSSLPGDYTKTLQGRQRKAAFLRAVLPLVLEANQKIRADRARAISILHGRTATASDHAWIAALSDRYRVEPGDTEELLRRVDTVPTSLALAQAALESGWGTSRFARKGNALFGQWTWKKGAGIAAGDAAPKAQVAVLKFDTMYDAVTAYMNNLNKGHAYEKFRATRAEIRKCHADITGTQLTATLTRYSIEREEYVRKLETMIRFNRLHEFDTAKFRDAAAGPFAQTRAVF